MIYGSKTAFLFRANRLVGVALGIDVLPNDIQSIVRPSPFDGLAWSLPNGIRAETSLPKIKQVLSLPDLKMNDGQRVVYEQDGTTVVLNLARQIRQDEQGNDVAEVVDADYVVYAVYLVRTADLPYLGIREEGRV